MSGLDDLIRQGEESQAELQRWYDAGVPLGPAARILVTVGVSVITDEDGNPVGLHKGENGPWSGRIDPTSWNEYRDILRRHDEIVHRIAAALPPPGDDR